MKAFHRLNTISILSRIFPIIPLTMTECDDPVESIKDDEGIDGFVAVELCEVFDLGNTPLVELKIVLFQAQSDLFKNVVDDCHFEIMMKFALLSDKVGKQVDVTILNFRWLGKHLL